MINCSKETKRYTVLAIDNTKRRGLVQADKILLNPKEVPGLKQLDVTAFFADAIYTEANAIEVAKRFNLPDFDGVDAFIAKNHPGIARSAQGLPVDTMH